MASARNIFLKISFIFDYYISTNAEKNAMKAVCELGTIKPD